MRIMNKEQYSKLKKECSCQLCGYIFIYFITFFFKWAGIPVFTQNLEIK